MKELKQYYRNIRKKLPCCGNVKNRFLEEFQTSIDAYLSENPSADFQAVQQRFGTSEQVVSAYTEELGTPEVMKKYKLRKWIISIVAATAALVLLIWATFLTSAFIRFSNSDGGYIETGSIIEEDLEVYK